GTAERDRKATKDSVSVLLVVPSHRGIKMAMPFKLLGDHASLVYAGGTPPAEIELLQRDDIHRHFGDNFGDSHFGTMPIHPDAAMHIVSGDAKPQCGRFIHHNL